MKAFGDDWLSVLGNKSDTGSLGLYGNIICFLVAMVTIEITWQNRTPTRGQLAYQVRLLGQHGLQQNYL